MTVVLTDAAVRAILDSGYDAIFNSGVLEIRTGAPPGPSAVPTGTVLATINLPADAFAAAAVRTKSKSGTWQDPTADNGGVAGHYRLKTSSDTGAATQNEARQEGTVTATGGGGDMTLDNTNIAANQTVTINGFSVSM